MSSPKSTKRKKKTESILMRVSRSDKSRWTKSARMEGLSLTKWIERTLNGQLGAQGESAEHDSK